LFLFSNTCKDEAPTKQEEDEQQGIKIGAWLEEKKKNNERSLKEE